MNTEGLRWVVFAILVVASLLSWKSYNNLRDVQKGVCGFGPVSDEHLPIDMETLLRVRGQEMLIRGGIMVVWRGIVFLAFLVVTTGLAVFLGVLLVLPRS